MLDAIGADQPRTSAALASSAACRSGQGARVGPNALGMIARFARNETIFAEGDEANFHYRIVEGAVRLSKVMPDGRRQIVDFMLPGDLMAIDAEDTYSLTAEALGTVVVTRYSRFYLQRLAEDAPELRREIMVSLRRELAAAQHHLLMLGRQTAKERVASFFLGLANRRRSHSPDRVDLPMSRQDIADYLGLTIETVCRTLAELKRLHVIATPERHYAVIQNASTLRAIAAGMN